MMPKDDKPMGPEDNTADDSQEPVGDDTASSGSDSPVTEEYIQEAGDGVNGLIPEDFDSMDLKVPTTAKDGDVVSMLITGVASGGRLTDIYGASITPQAPEEKKGRLREAMMGGNQEGK